MLFGQKFKRPKELVQGNDIMTSNVKHKKAAQTAAGKKVNGAIIGRSAAMEYLRDMISRVAPSNASVLICGPSGSGKELVARALHDESPRKSGQYVALNCGAVPCDLMESELFGHERGSFTGASAQRAGRFEQADGGTLFLDEIGDMRYDMQVKLLRIVEERTVTRVGSNTARAVDVRIVSATHQDIDGQIAENRFRADLFFRLGVVILRVPPLCERLEDVPDLIAHFQRSVVSDARVHFDSSAMQLLQQYDWPGNVRELRNVVERATILFGGQTVSARHISMLLSNQPLQAAPRNRGQGQGQSFDGPATPAKPSPFCSETLLTQGNEGQDAAPINLKEMIEHYEQDSIRQALENAAGVTAEAARLLSLKRTTLVEKMRKYGLVYG